MNAETSRALETDHDTYDNKDLEKLELHHHHPRTKVRYSIFDQETYEIKLKHCEIRPNKGAGLKARVKTAWTIKVGIFKEYLREEKPELIEKCFEADWNFMKMPRFKQSEPDEIKEAMRKIYPMLVEAYKVQAGYEPAGNVFSIGMNRMGAFMSDEWLNCIDGEG